MIGKLIYAFYNLPRRYKSGIQDNDYLGITNSSIKKKMSRQIFQVYMEPNNITTEKVSRILDRLNSLNSATEIMNAVGSHMGQRVLSPRIAQRILNAKMQTGKFKDLNQVAIVPGIGHKRFTIIMSALNDSAPSVSPSSN